MDPNRWIELAVIRYPETTKKMLTPKQLFRPKARMKSSGTTHGEVNGPHVPEKWAKTTTRIENPRNQSIYGLREGDCTVGQSHFIQPSDKHAAADRKAISVRT